MRNSNLIGAALIALSLSGTAFVAHADEPGKPIAELYVKSGVALEGYDAVSYFTDGKPTPGNAEHEVDWRGARWQFTSKEHADAFKANPEHYAPQYGGYCAYAVSIGKTATGDPRQWAIVKNKLYVNNNPLAMQLWDKDRGGNIKNADQNWPQIPKEPVAGAQ
jgi:YHS domain-containing protein